MKSTIKILITTALFYFLPAVNQAKAQGLDDGALRVSYSLMYLSSSTEQGGKGAEGSSFLSETEIIAKSTWFNYGAFLQYDSIGDAQGDLEIGYKLELEYEPFYFEYGQALYVQRSYNDRSIETQEGYGYRLGMGVRVPLDLIPGFYMQFSFKSKTQIIETQDGSKLDDKITHSITYPMFGLGMSL